jgi:hypothetical protein
MQPFFSLYPNLELLPWQTIARMYPWQLTTPLSRGSVMAGPSDLPDDILALPTVKTANNGSSPPHRRLTVYTPRGQPQPEALVELFKQGFTPIAQGLTDGNGQLDIYGAVEGDIIKAISFNGGTRGQVTVPSGLNFTLALTPTNNQQSAYMEVKAKLSQTPGQIDLTISLLNFGVGAAPKVNISEPDSRTIYTPTLSYNSTTDTYQSQISFNSNRRGTGQLWVEGQGGNAAALHSAYRLQQVVNSQDYELHSSDGNLNLYLNQGSLPGSEAYLVVMPPGGIPGPLPEGLSLVRGPYDVTAAETGTFIKPVILTLHYNGASGTPAGLGIYRWDSGSQVWQIVPNSSLNEEHQAVVAPVTNLGMYALLAPPGSWNQGPSNVFLPVILK